MDENADARLKEILEKNDQAAFRELYDSMEPIDFAQLIEDYEPEELEKLTAMLEDDQLAVLETALREAGERHCLVCFHHQPVDIGCAWIAPIGLRNGQALFDIVEG